MLRVLVALALGAFTPQAHAEPPRVAVLPFDAPRSAEGAGARAAEEVARKLNATGGWTALSPGEVPAAFEQRGRVATPGLVDAATALAAGRALGVDHLVVGRVLHMDAVARSEHFVVMKVEGRSTRVELAVQVIDARSGAVLTTAKGTGVVERGGPSASNPVDAALVAAVDDLAAAFRAVREGLDPVESAVPAAHLRGTSSD